MLSPLLAPTTRASLTRLARLNGAAMALALFGACGASDSATVEGRGWNVLLIVIDTLRADHLGVYGHAAPTSPRIDALAKEGVVFDGMYSQAPWTKPSIASLFTSLYPGQHLVLKEGTDNQLSLSLTTLAEVLSQAGYRTGAVSQNPHVQAKTGFDQGFDEFHGLSGYQSGVDQMVKAGEGFLDGAADQPFFLYMHFLDPHGPYAPPPKLRKQFLGRRKTDQERVLAGRVGKMLDGEALTQEFTPRDLAYLEALYDAEIRWVDTAVGRLLDGLQSRGLGENTLVVLTADHGEEFLDHGTVKHGYHVYEESVHIPLIIKAPGFAVGRNREGLAQHVDLMPTFLDLLEIEGPGELQGQSLRAMLAEPSASLDRTIFQGSSWRDIERFSVREGDWKLVRHVDEDKTALFKLSDDPQEQVDLAPQHPDVVERLTRSYFERTAPIEGITPLDATGARDPELEKRLQAIGYTGGSDDEHDH